MADITTSEDITKFMVHFYDRLLEDPVAAPVFAGIDMVEHIPKVASFWSGIAFGESSYRGAPLMRHIPLGLTTAHFEIWYETFSSSLDTLFTGPVATTVKERAHSIAFIFTSRLGLAAPNI
jgi:hemoglobin